MRPDSYLLFGFGHLGRPLAERLHQHGATMCAVKRSLTSDDINLPINIDIQPLTPQSSLKTWAQYSTWLLMLPPSQVSDYVATHAQLIKLAEQYNVNHLIFTGSTSVYGNQARICDEDSTREPETESARQITTVETLLTNSCINNIDILHLGGLYSATRHPLFSLLKHSQIQGPNQPVNMLHQDRAVAALFQAAIKPNGRRIRNLVETPHISKLAFYTREAGKLGCPIPDFDLSDQKTAGKTVISKYSDFPNDRYVF